MLKQVVWIDQTHFICKLVESVFKERGVSCYTLDKAKDFSYLLKDLKPDVLICDLATVTENLSAFENEVEQYKGIVLSTATLADFESFHDYKFHGFIPKPLQVESIYQNVLKAVKA